MNNDRRSGSHTFQRDSEGNFYTVNAIGQRVYLPPDEDSYLPIIQRVREAYHNDEVCDGGAGAADSLYFHIECNSREYWYLFYRTSGQRKPVRLFGHYVGDNETVYMLYSKDSGEMYVLRKGEVVREALNRHLLSQQILPTAIIRVDYTYSPENLEEVSGAHIVLRPLALKLK